MFTILQKNLAETKILRNSWGLFGRCQERRIASIVCIFYF